MLKRVGRLVGAGVAFTFGAAVTVSLLVGTGELSQLRSAVWAGLVFCGVTLPLGWWFGSCYDRLKRWAEQDALTAVCTRRFLQQVYPRLVRQADRKTKRFSVILIDVDNFKTINDTYGHARGDELLRKLASVLKGAAGHGEIIGRWGGDEFVMLCPYGDPQSLDKLHRALDERTEQLARQWQVPISVSVGSAVYPDEGRLLDELIQQADRSMYKDKNRSKPAVTHKLQA